MADRIEIPLHSSSPPGLSQVFGWVLSANIFVIVTVAIVVVVMPWIAGHQPELEGSTLVMAGAVGIALMIGYLWFAFRRHQQQQLATPRAHLVLDAETATLRPVGSEPKSCARDAFVAQPVHVHEKLRGVDYFLGPGLELRVEDLTWVVTHIDGARRWGHDPKGADHVDFLVNSANWAELLAALELEEALVDYEDESIEA